MLQGFYYANGVALAPDDSYVVMAETDMTRVHKVWVSGPKVRAHCTAQLRVVAHLVLCLLEHHCCRVGCRLQNRAGMRS